MVNVQAVWILVQNRSLNQLQQIATTYRPIVGTAPFGALLQNIASSRDQAEAIEAGAPANPLMGDAGGCGRALE